MMFGCGVIVLQNIVSSSKIFMVLDHWTSGSTNHHTVAMAEKVNYNEKKLRILVCNNSSDEC